MTVYTVSLGPRLALLLLLGALLWACPARGATPISDDLGQTLDTASADQDIRFIVYFTSPPEANGLDRPLVEVPTLIGNLQHTASVHLPDAQELAESMDGTDIRQLWMVNALAVTGPPSLVRTFGAMADVERITPDYVLNIRPLPSVPQASRELPPEDWNMLQVNAVAAHAYGLLGNGTVVGTLDSGVDLAPPDIAQAWRGGLYSWFDPYGESLLVPFDDYETKHGTKVTGLMCAGNATGRYMGVAPGAQWIAARLFDATHTIYLSTLGECYQWLLDPDGNPLTNDFPVAVNNSWGYVDSPGECIATMLEIYLSRFEDAGIAMIFAAGNCGEGGPNTGISPANNDGAFSVGGTQSDGELVGFSSRGPATCDGRIFPDVIGPATYVPLLTPTGATVDTGTSFAAPHVTGAVALLAGTFPNALKRENDTTNVQLIFEALRAGATDLNAPGPDNNSGYGRLDILASYDYLLDTLGICRADMNLDQQVDEADYALFAAELSSGQTTQCHENACPADFNLDGQVDIHDLSILRQEIGRECPER